MSKRSDVMAALVALAESSIAAAALGRWSLLPRVELRPSKAAIDVPPEGVFVLRDQGLLPETEEIGLGADKNPRAMTLTVGIEAYVAEQPSVSAEQAADDLMAAFGDRIESDYTLGGLVDECELAEGESENFAELGIDRIAGRLQTLTAAWNAERSLG